MSSHPPQNDTQERRTFLTWLSRLGMTGGLIAAYGTLVAFMGRFLYPARPTTTGWMFVAPLDGIREGETLVYRTPAGSPVNITRKGTSGTAEDFIALSSTCPHLGCQVHWQPQNNRYFCPCHNGVFDPSGKGIGGPPGEAGQSLLEFPLEVESGLLYIEVPLGEFPATAGIMELPPSPSGPGHDPCLHPLATLGRKRS